jgi:cell fate (sporulation/competence/biofilm development) regulator YlbF (YheA/YmcA/DUF963 family)
MNRIEEHTSNLIEAVKESNEYLQYRNLLAQVMEDINLYNEINEFRKKSISIQLHADRNLLDISNELYSEYSRLLGDPLVADFLSSEQAYCRMLREMNDRIMDSLDLDIDFLED